MGKRKKIIRYFILPVIIELFVCNFRTWLTAGYHETDFIQENKIAYQSGQYKKDGCMIAPFRDDGGCDIDTGQINLTARNLYLNVQYLDSSLQPAEEFCIVDCTVTASDEGNRLFYVVGRDKKFSNSLERGNYYSMNLYGKAQAFTLQFQKPEGDIQYVCLSKFAVNKPVPFYFSWLRLLAVIFCFICIGFCKNTWSQPFYKKANMQERKMIAVAVCILVCGYCLVYTYANPANRSADTYRTLYHELTESLLQGRFYLEEEPAQVIVDMENPYDSWYRKQLVEEHGQYSKLDTAYYDGKYYVYFGVVPVLLLFLPYYVMTGQHLPMAYAISILAIVYIIGCFLLLWKLYKKYFAQASFLSYLLWSVMMVMGTGMFYAFRAGPGSFYACPILTAAVLTVWALNLWIDEMGKKTHNYRRIMAGALLFSLVAGSRPQFLAAAFSVFFLFKREIFRKPDKEWAFLAGSVLTPVVFVAMALMYYNYARFGSPFDFGANYNLTSNDMTHRGWHLDRIPSGLFYYLFEPTKVTLTFPYIQDSCLMNTGLSDYMGKQTFERPFGGLFFNGPVLLLSMAVCKIRKFVTDVNRQVFSLAGFFAGIAVLILMVDVQVGGIMSRYHMDYGIFLCLAAMIVMAFLQIGIKERIVVKGMHLLLAGSVAWRIVYEMLLWFGEKSILVQRPYLIFYLRNLIQFWH